MPNGYTSDIYEGKGGWDSLRGYLMGVGRSMSMSLMQRDDDPSDSVKLRVPSEYTRRRVTETNDHLKALRAMLEDDIASAARAEYGAQRQEHLAAWASNHAMRRRYDLMIERVEAWEPEPIVAYVKEHALKYLREGREFDTGHVYPRAPVPDDFEPEAWYASQLDQAERSFKRACEDWQKEVERVAGFNLHIEAFHRSLPDA